MEARRITIVSTREQKKYVINSTAETLGELKNELRNANINYTDMTFMEGLTKTEMKEDASLLPRDVQRVNRQTGETVTTNELVFMLTNTAKKIRSGANPIISMSRADIYSYIKAHNLQNVIAFKYGKNFTQCTTEALRIAISEDAQSTAATTTAAPKTETESKCNLEVAFNTLIAILKDDGTLSYYDVAKINTALRGEVEETTCSASPYTDAEIDEMFKNI